MSQCNCLINDLPIDPCNDDCWHFSSHAGSNCANCNRTGEQLEAPEKDERILVADFVFSALKKRGGAQSIIDELMNQRSTIAALTDQNAEQARRLEEAQTVIDEALYSLKMYGASVAANACHTWLAANAAPLSEAARRLE